MNRDDMGIGGLPETLPVFPLSGALLLPHGHLPLNIFEPRYLNMIDDSLGRGRFFGLVRPTQSHIDPVAEQTALFPIGCLGRIVSFDETPDGRYMIALRGICRFRISHERAPENGYRSCRVDYSEFADDLRQDGSHIEGRDRLLAAVRRYLELAEIDVDWDVLHDTADETLVTSLAMICAFEPGEQQALLESPDLQSRSKLLASLMDMAQLGNGPEPGTT
ncbi:MAG TPA: peptidase S16, partial [Rhodospirillales bacterium]|nr:peptidase S16 [Rhodospirillales bacterium]